jgi:hypothetical protein
MENSIAQEDSAQSMSNKQRLFTRYFTAILVDLTVLNLFEEYWDNVVIGSFTISLFAAIVLQVLLQLTIVFEHKVAAYFKSKSGTSAKVQRFFATWAILFFSKIIILEAINIAFGDKVLFLGAFHGLVAFIVVVIALLVAEKAIIKLYHSLA